MKSIIESRINSSIDNDPLLVPNSRVPASLQMTTQSIGTMIPVLAGFTEHVTWDRIFYCRILGIGYKIAVEVTFALWCGYPIGSEVFSQA